MLYKNWTIYPVCYVTTFDWQATNGQTIIKDCKTIRAAEEKIDAIEGLEKIERLH